MRKGWRTQDLGFVATLQRGYDLPHRDRRPGTVPVVTSSGLGETHSTAMAAAPGVVTGRYGTIGQVFYLEEQFWPLNTTLFVRNFHGNDPRFVSYLLRTIDFHSHSGKSGVPGVNRNDLHKLTVSLPESLEEQKAIAAALSDVDALLGALDRLIAKKRDVKQAVMQQLLSGQTRLPGFSGAWEPTTLGAIGRWLSGGTPAKANEDFWLGDIPWVSPKDMKVARIHDSIDHVGPAAIGNGTRLLPAGAILVVVRGMILAHTAPVARAERAVAFNQDIKGLVVNPDVDSTFLLWWLVAHESLLLSTTNEATHGTKRIPTDELFKLSLRLPSLPEQAAIAGAISDMDAELTALERRRDKTRLLKHGMMQELLTGRTRLA